MFSITAIVPFALQAAQPSIAKELDVEQLYSLAKQKYDLNFEDAIYLFNSRQEQWLPDGRLKTMVHQIIWINGDDAQDHFGDNRVAYDKAHRDLTVMAVRTWRLGRDNPPDKWWEHTGTAIVETTPFALASAPDYSGVRETMLLVNGIELPCVVEIAYIIEDREPFRKGAEGQWLFSSREPTLWSWFKLGVPLGQKPNYFASEGVPTPEKTTHREQGIDIYTWKMEDVARLGNPHTPDPALYSPQLTWSTWQSWESFGNYLKSDFEKAMKLDDVLRDSVSTLIKDANTLMDKALNIANFVNRKTRSVHYDENYWWTELRPAQQTYLTAYGHGLDRAALAAAMLKEAGFAVWLCYFSDDLANIDHGIPTLAGMSGAKIWISGNNLEAFYDPANDKVAMGFAPIYGKTVWLPGSEGHPSVRYCGEGETSVLDLRFNLNYCPEEKQFFGSGFYRADGGFCSYHKMIGNADKAKSQLKTIASGVIANAEVTEYNPFVFDPISTTVSFTLKAMAKDVDAFGRLPLTLGDPADGVFEMLPGNVHLYQEHRTSPVILWGKMEQRVELRLNLEKLETVYLPESFTLENSAGVFSLTKNIDGEHLTLTRTLSLNKSWYDAEDWKDLRALLLAEKHEKNRDLYFK